MRPPGGITPELLNYANSTNVYKVWADMIAFDRSTQTGGKHCFCVFAGRRDGKDFLLSHQDVLDKYGDKLRIVDRVPDALSACMANQMYVATFSTQRELDRFYKDVFACRA